MSKDGNPRKQKIIDLIINDKEMIKNITGKDDLTEIHLHLNYETCQVSYEDNKSNFSISYLLPFFYKIKMYLIEKNLIEKK